MSQFPPSSAFAGPTVWANGANYPVSSNAWSATPLKVTPGYSYFTPKNAVTAQELNELLYSITSADSVAASGTGLLAQFTPVMGQEFPFGCTMLQYGSGSDPTLGGAVWDPYNYQWLACIYGTGFTNVPYLFRSADGSSWLPSTTVKASGTMGLGGIASAPGGTIVIWDRGIPNFWFSVDGGVTFTVGTSSLPSSLSTASESMAASQMTYFNGNFYLLTQTLASSHYSVKLWYAPAASFGATTVWTDITEQAKCDDNDGADARTSIQDVRRKRNPRHRYLQCSLYARGARSDCLSYRRLRCRCELAVSLRLRSYAHERDVLLRSNGSIRLLGQWGDRRIASDLDD